MRKTNTVPVHCSKCGGDEKLDIGNLTKAEIDKFLSREGTWECHIGHHVENTPRKNFWTIDWEKKAETEEMDDDECKRSLEAEGYTIYTPEQMNDEFVMISCEGGICVAQERVTSLELEFKYDTLPSSTRIYYR